MKNKKIKNSINLFSRELYFLLSQFGSVVVLGWENPYHGWLAEEIEADQKKALKSLVDRDLVHMVSENEIALDGVLALMVGACALPEHTCIINHSLADGQKQTLVHFREGFIVEHVINGDEHQLTAIRDLNTLQDRYQDILRVNSSTSTKGKSWSLSQQGLDDSKEKLETGDEEAARGILKKEKLSTANIEKMVAALSEPIANAAIAIIINHRTTEKQHVCGMAYLEGRDDFWFLQPFEKNDQKWVEFKPGSAKKVKEKFLELLPKEIK